MIPSVLAGLGGAITLAATGAPHCAGMCGPFAAGALGAPTQSAHAGPALAWQSGRAAAYTSLGAIAGAVGSVRLFDFPAGPALTVVALIWAAARVAGVPLPHVRLPPSPLLTAAGRLARRSDLGARFLFGMLAATLPCGLLWSGLALAAGTGSAPLGALLMSGFYLGTLPALLVATRLLRSASTTGPAARRLAAAAVLALGLWSVGTRSGWWSPPNADGTPACHGAHAPSP